MPTNTLTSKKGIVEALKFTPQTTKRVAWESWKFTVVGPFQIAVTNASYGYLKRDHTYHVTVAECDGQFMPAECECKADRYTDEFECKHKVALATAGGPVVLDAANDYPTTRPTTKEIAADGGQPESAGAFHMETCPHEQEGCPGSDADDFCCFDSFTVQEAH